MVGARLAVGGTVVRNGAGVPISELLDLLDAVHAQRSVRGAASTLGLSYRAVWGRAAAYEEALGQKLVVKTKGHGTGLAPAGLQMRDLLRKALNEMEAAREAAEARLGRELQALFEERRQPCRVALSHDPLLLQASSAFAGEFDLRVMGSSEALEQVRAGLADAAGFHDGTEEGLVTLPGLIEAGFLIVPLFRREQGLMLAPGNPLGISSLAEVAGRSVRFVNRQKGSGTRAWFDRLLAEAGLSARDIRGYEAEEFTHGAVAAMVASGEADAGMGVRAAAERFGLAFLPLGRETYFLASREADSRLAGLADAVRLSLDGASGYVPAQPL